MVGDPDAFAETSIAGRGLFAAERLLFDEAFGGPSDYRCRLILAVARDLALRTEAILELWRREHAPLSLSAGKLTNDLCIDAADRTLALFDALLGGLQATADPRLGRPLDSFDRLRPTQAKAWRSDRTLRNVALSL